MTRFSRAMSHLKSTQIDEKIKVLNKELEKTGVLAEQPANSTANFYYSVEPIPGTPAEMTAVPDPEGILTGEWNQPSNGYDSSDPNTWENAFNDWSWLRNPNDVAGETDRPVTVSQPVDWEGGVAGAGTMIAIVGHGPALGYVSNAGVFEPLVTSSYWSSLVPPTDANRGGGLSGKHYSSSIPENKWSTMQAMYSSYESMGESGATTKVIKVWYPWSYFWYGSWETYAGTKKGGDTGRYVLLNATMYLDPNEYQTKAAVPAYDLITRDSLDDPKYYPGNPNRFMDFLRDTLDVGEKALDWLTDKAGEVRDTVQDTLDQFMDELEGNESNLPPKVKDFIQDTKDSSLTQSIIDNVLEPFREKMAEKRIIPAAQNVVNYLTDNLPDNLDNDYLNSLEDGYVDKVIASGRIQDDGTFFAGENIVGTAQVPRVDGDYVEIDFNMGFKDNITDFADRAADPLYGEVNPVMQAIYDFLGPYSFDAQTSTGVPLIDMAAGYIFSELIEKAKLYGGAQDKPGTLRISKEKLKELNGPMYTSLVWDGIITEGLSLSEGWESPKHTYIDKDQQKRWFNADDVAPVYPKDPPPEMIRGYHPKLLSKSQHSIPYIKVTKKDLIRSHKLTKDEAQEMIQLVDRLNEFIKNNPDKLAYARERYPKDDVRLAELNFKLDMQLAAADDYIETQFPENKRRLKLIQRAVRKSTELTDPKTYKKNSKYLPFEDTGILRTVNDLETYGAPTRKKKTRKKNKWIQKPKKKTKQDIMNEKMIQLEMDMKKFT